MEIRVGFVTNPDTPPFSNRHHPGSRIAHSEPSEAIRSEVEKQAKRLEKFYDRITSCHVTVIAPTMKRRHGDVFKIDICIAMPQHKEILVSKAHGDAPEHEHVTVAIKDAFAAAQRQIEDAARELRG